MPRKKVVQPDTNIGLVGHVDHGKTTLTEKLSGSWTDTHSEELKRGITIRLGYANVSIYKKDDTFLSQQTKGAELVRRISLVDAPGHESLMATMLSGATIMDGALLLIAANEEFPQPQTREHLTALEIVGITNVIIVQNKIDLVTPEKAKQQYDQIQEYLNDTAFKDSPVVPISAFHGINIDLLLQTIMDHIPSREADPKKDPLMLVARSFDINKPGSDPAKMNGGVMGGAVIQGVFKKGDAIALAPDVRVGDKQHSLSTKITGLQTGKDKVTEAMPGGSVAVMTELDPSLTHGDSVAGRIVGLVDKLPPVWNELKLEVHLLERVVGTKDEQEIKPLAQKEVLMINVNAAATVGVVMDMKKGVATCKLKIPVCAYPGDRATISRRFGNRFRLVGYGIIQ